MDSGTSSDILAELAALGTEQTLKTWRRHGVEGEAYGVLTSALEKIRKRIKVDHDLARELWSSGNHDARILATMIADAARFGANELQGMAKELGNYVITDAFATLASRSPHARELSADWRTSDEEWIGRAGWLTLAMLARADVAPTNEMLEEQIEVIECSIHSRKNRVRDAMNSALIAIGVRNERLKTRALEAAEKIGKVEVDHGDTNCRTPDAAEYIARAEAQALAQAQKAEAKTPRRAKSAASGAMLKETGRKR